MNYDTNETLSIPINAEVLPGQTLLNAEAHGDVEPDATAPTTEAHGIRAYRYIPQNGGPEMLEISRGPEIASCEECQGRGRYPGDIYIRCEGPCRGKGYTIVEEEDE